MPNSYHYDPNTGELVKRPPRNPTKRKGATAGRKCRLVDIQKGIYPREGLPISRKDRPDDWIKAYQQAYYQPQKVGRPMLGDSPRVTITISVDRSLVEIINASGYQRSEVLSAGVKALKILENHDI